MEQKHPDKDRSIAPNSVAGDERWADEQRSGADDQTAPPPERPKIRDTPKDARTKRTLQPPGPAQAFSGLLQPGHEPIPGYRLEKFLGRGQYGEVWSATGPGRVAVALKFIDLRGAHGLKEFRGVQRVKAIRHANVMPITGLWMIAEDGEVASDDVLDDYGPPGDSTLASTLAATAVDALVERSRPRLLVVAMLLANCSLDDRLTECRRQGLPGVPQGELLGYMEEAAKGIDFLNAPRHDFGEGLVAIQHCDIKPANLVLVGNSVLVCDFGLARLLGDASATATGLVGSLAYMAPESIAQRPSRASDQYALAITYYELRTGRLPFVTEDFSSVMDAHRGGQLDFSAVPPAELEVLRRATAVRPESRFPSCCDFVRQLRAPDSESTPRRTPAPGRRRWAAIVATAALLLACAVGAWAAFSLLTPPPADTNTAAGGQDLLVLQPAAPRVLIDGVAVAADEEGRIPLPAGLDEAFELRIPRPDDEHVDYVRTLTVEELSRLGFRIDYRFSSKAVGGDNAADDLARAQEAAQQALQLADERFDEAVELYKKAIEHDKDQAAVPLPEFTLPGSSTRAVATARSGRWLATGGVGGHLLRWDLEHLDAQPQTLASLDDTIGTLEISPSGRWVACGTSRGMVFLCELDAAAPRPIQLLQQASEIRALAFSRDGRMLAAAAGQTAVAPVIHLWDLSDMNSGAAGRRLKGHTENINALAFSHDGQWLYSGGIDNRVLRWDAAADAPQPKIIHDGTGDIEALACHPSQSMVAFGGVGTDVTLVRDDAGSSTQMLQGHAADIEVIVFSGDGSRLATADQDGFTLVWDCNDFSTPARLEGQTGIVADAAFIPPGDWLATASWDRTVGLWDLSAGTKTPLLLDHPEKLEAVRVSPDGAWLVTLAEDGVVRVWNIRHCKLVKRACDELGQIPLRRREQNAKPLEVRGRHSGARRLVQR